MPKKLLLVDDDRVDRSLFVDALAGMEDVEVVVTGDGRQGLEYLRRNGPNTLEAPSVVFLDLGMPNVNGFELLREFHRQADAHRVPIVVFTSSQAEADVYLSYEFGANAFVVKPQEPGRLQQIAKAAAAFWLNSNVVPGAR